MIAEAIGPRRSPPSSGGWERIEVTGRDRTALLVDWANELIGRSEVTGRAYGDVRNLTVESAAVTANDRRDVKASWSGDVRLKAEARGDLVEEWVSPVKAATYHGALLERRGREWRAEVLFDV